MFMLLKGVLIPEIRRCGAVPDLLLYTSSKNYVITDFMLFHMQKQVSFAMFVQVV